MIQLMDLSMLRGDRGTNYNTRTAYLVSGKNRSKSLTLAKEGSFLAILILFKQVQIVEKSFYRSNCLNPNYGRRT